MTDRRVGSPHASKRRWKDASCAGVCTFAVRKTVRPRDEAEQHPDAERGRRTGGEHTGGDGEEHGGRHDVRGDPDPDLPPEADAVQPAAVARQPVFVDLAAEEGRAHTEHAAVDRGRDDRQHGEDRQRGVARQVGGRGGRGAEGRDHAERGTAGDRTHHEPPGGHTEAVVAGPLGERRDLGEHRLAAR